jgi:Ca-activated chloride channel family protein
MCNRILIALTILAAAVVVPVNAQAPAEQPPQVFRSAVDLVTIQASVRDAHGRALSGLSPADFEVRDNGQLRPILSLQSDRQSPVNLAILVDISGSMGVGSKIAMARQAFDSVLNQLKDGEDEVALFTFDSSLRERHGFTADLASLKDELWDFEAFGTTSLYDATAATARRLADRTGTHKAIIVLTDGLDTSSTLTASEVSALASSIDVPVFVVATVPALDQRVILEAAPHSDGADLRDLAEWTGGQLVFSSSFTESAVVAFNLVSQLRQQYVLAIEAAGGPEWRRLDVRVTRHSAVVKARSGYFGG